MDPSLFSSQLCKVVKARREKLAEGHPECFVAKQGSEPRFPQYKASNPSHPESQYGIFYRWLQHYRQLLQESAVLHVIASLVNVCKKLEIKG